MDHTNVQKEILPEEVLNKEIDLIKQERSTEVWRLINESRNVLRDYIKQRESKKTLYDLLHDEE